MRSGRLPGIRSLPHALLLPGVCALVLWGHVYADFDRVRMRVVTDPLAPQGRTLTVPLPDLRPLGDAPAALVAHLRGAPSPIRVAIAFDGHRLTEVDVPPEGEIRVDASAWLDWGAGHRMTFSGSGEGWRLAYLEVANVHGFAGRPVSLQIVPRERPRPAVLPIWLLVPLLAGLVALRPRWDWPPHRVLRGVHRAAGGVVLALFGATLLAPLLTPYAILLSIEGLLVCLAILYAEPLARLWPAERARQRLRETCWDRAVAGVLRQWHTRPRLRQLLPHAFVVLVFLVSVAQFYEREHGFTIFMYFGEEFREYTLPVLQRTPHRVDPGWGYDGQFYAQMALDPLLRSDEIGEALDAPAYRGRRILFPAFAWVLGLGQPWYVLQAYALLNVMAWLALAWLLLRWLPPGNPRTVLAWAACLLSEGMLVSVRRALTDGPSMLLLALAVLAVEARRRWLAAGILAASGLGRETNLLGGAILPRDLRPRTLASTALQGLLIVAPLLVWLIYLRGLGLAPGDGGARNFALPLVGFAEKWMITVAELGAEGWESYARFSFYASVALTTQAIVLVSRPQWQSPWWRLGIAYLALMAVAGPAIWEGHEQAITRVVLPMTFAFNVLLPGHRWFWPLWILGNLNVLVGLSAIQVPGLHGRL